MSAGVPKDDLIVVTEKDRRSARGLSDKRRVRPLFQILHEVHRCGEGAVAGYHEQLVGPVEPGSCDNAANDLFVVERIATDVLAYVDHHPRDRQ